MRYLIYIRVSTPDQIKNTSLEKQEKWALAQCKQAGAHKSAIDLYREPGLSAENITARPQLIALLAQVDTGEVDGSSLFVYDQDRLSRSVKDLTGRIFPRLEDHNIKVITKYGELDLSSRDGQMFAQIKGVISEHQRRYIKDLCSEGRKIRLQQGYIHGRLPIGYQYDRNHYILTPGGKKRNKIIQGKDADIVRRVFVAGFDHDYITVGSMLRGAGIDIYGYQVSLMLRRPLYAGLINIDGQYIKCVQIDEPIISEDEFFDLQNRLESYKTRVHRPRQKSLLAPMMICGYCGSRIIAMSAGGSHGYPHRYLGYRCYNAFRNGKRACPRSSSRPQWLINQAIDNNIRSQTGDKKKLKRLLDAKIREYNKTDLTGDRLRLQELIKQKNNLVDAIQAGVVDLNDCKRNIDKIKTEIDELQQRDIRSDSLILDVDELIDRFQDFSLDVPDDIRTKYYMTAIKKIIIYSRMIIIDYRYLPKTEVEFNLPPRGVHAVRARELRH